MAQITDSISLEDDDRLFVDDVSCFNPSDVKLPADETLDDEDGEEELPNLKLKDAINLV